MTNSVLIAATGNRTFASQLHDAGADRIVAYHSSAYRNVGLPSVAGLLPWASANEQTLKMLPEVIYGAAATPVLATVCANDGLIPAGAMLESVRSGGAVGILNAPTVGLLEGVVRSALEAEGLGRSAELGLNQQAAELGLECWNYVFDAEWTSLAVREGATGIIVHLGITGYPPAGGLTSIELAETCIAAARREDPSIPVLLHGGNLRHPAALSDLLRALTLESREHVAGFMGASVFESEADTLSTLTSWRSALSNTREGQ